MYSPCRHCMYGRWWGVQKQGAVRQSCTGSRPPPPTPASRSTLYAKAVQRDWQTGETETACTAQGAGRPDSRDLARCQDAVRNSLVRCEHCISVPLIRPASISQTEMDRQTNIIFIIIIETFVSRLLQLLTNTSKGVDMS